MESTDSQANIKKHVFAAGTIIGESYEVIELLGRGAMGMVYRVRHVTLSTEYALKILTDDKLNEVSVIRFQNEAQAIAKLNHPNIVAIYNFGIHDGSLPFYVMDLLEGEDLLDKIVFAGPMATEEALPLFIEACAGFSFAHRKGILHRDVKPANLLILDKLDVHGARLKVVDFGIVKFAEELKPEVQKLTTMGIVCGSPSYMSPEQASGQKVDPRSDIYSLGCSLFEALTGKVPYRGRSASDTMMMHVDSPSPSLASKNPEGKFSDELEVLVARMMAKEPMHRYQSMEAVAQDLKNVLAGKPLGTKLLEQSYSNEQDASGKYASEDDYHESESETESASEEETKDSSGIVKVALVSLLMLGIVGAASFFASQYLRPARQSRAKLDSNDKSTKNDQNNFGHILTNLGDLEPDPKVPSIKLTDAKYFSKIVTIDGKKFIQFDFSTKSGALPLAWIGTSMTHYAAAWGTLKFPRNEKLFLMPSPNALRKKEFLDKFRKGDIYQVIVGPTFASDAMAIECARTPGIKSFCIKDCPQLTAGIIPGLNRLNNLESFNASNSRINGLDLAKLKFLPSLKRVTLSRCINLTPILTALSGSKKLEVLYAADTGIDSADYRLISNIPNLKGLVINGNKISAEDLRWLSHLPCLKELSLVNVHIKDGSVVKELERFPSLRILFADRGQFKKQDLAYLREHVPNLRVQFYTAASTDSQVKDFLKTTEQL